MIAGFIDADDERRNPFVNQVFSVASERTEIDSRIAVAIPS